VITLREKIGRAFAAWIEAHHKDARVRFVGNVLEVGSWYTILVVLYSIMLNQAIYDEQYDLARARQELSAAQILEQDPKTSPDSANGQSVRAEEFAVRNLVERLEEELAIADRYFGFGFMAKARSGQFLGILLGALLPALTLIATGKTPILLFISIPMITRGSPAEDLGAIDQRLFRMVESSKRKEVSASSLALLLLIAGILTAFSGVYFFYTVTSIDSNGPVHLISRLNLGDATKNLVESTTDKSTVAGASDNNDVWKTVVDDLANALPRIGVLVFVEIVALFFLKQYQAMREEHRYFEAIRRCREDTALLLKLLETKDASVPADKLLEQLNLYSSAGVLKAGETIALHEERKITKDELGILAEMWKTTINQFSRSGS